MADGFKVTGIPELKAKFDQLGTTKAEKCIRTALKAGAEIEKAAIEERAPERPDLPSGTALPPGALKADITVQVKRSDQGNLAAIVQPGELTFHVARWVEEGHRLVRDGYSREVFKDGEGTGKYRGPGRQVTDGKGDLVFVPPHSFVRKAYEATRDQVAEVIATTLSQEIDKATKGK